MKKLVLSIICMCLAFILEAQVKEGNTYSFSFPANMHTMTGTDTTVYLEVKGNGEYSVQVIASGVDSTSATIQLMASNSITSLTDFVDIGDTTYTLVKTTRTPYMWTGTSLPYDYIAIKYTQGNVDHAVITAVICMKQRW